MSSYDHNLLGEAPRATRAQLQEGYNVDLLQQPPRRASSVHTPSPQSPRPQPVTAETDKLGTPASTYAPAASKPRSSFWRSRTCFVIAIVTFLIIIGAVVGGAVGGTIKRISDSVVTTASHSSSASPSSPSIPTADPTAQTSQISPSIPTAQSTTQTAQGFGGGGSSTSGFTTFTPTSVSRPASTGGQNTGMEAVPNY